MKTLHEVLNAVLNAVKHFLLNTETQVLVNLK